DVIKYGRLLGDKGAQSVIVSLGGVRALCLDKKISIKAVYPQGKVVNIVGTGGSTVAGVVAGTVAGLTVGKAFQQAVASGIHT
ncbi:phosphofructokinase, partial [Staphylococcus aureus]|uniref:PfkB family carbohydrate kinase n=1 Tax=Staphylococcus aureus TaxID=1280 RepID=UPI00065BE75C